MSEPEPTSAGDAPPRAFLPAMARPSLLPFYDTMSRLLGAGPAHARLVAQADPPPGGRVLEIGCGTGNVLARMWRARPDVEMVGIDPDAAALDRARTKLPGSVRLERGYADALPLPDAHVDRVLSSFMFHHLPPDQQPGALREVRRVLRPGGSLHLVDIASGGPHGLVVRAVGAASAALGHGHGHGHGHEQPRPHLRGADDLLTLMTEAGLVDAVVAERRRWVLGTVTSYRAVRAPRGG